MSFWTFLAGKGEGEAVEVEVDTVPGGTHTEEPTSTEKPTVIVRTDADGSVRTIINTNGGNYNERIEGNYIQCQDSSKRKKG